MKKFIYGIFVLMILFIFIMMTQISCEKTVAQQNTSLRESSVDLILLKKDSRIEVAAPDSIGKPPTKTTVFINEYYTMNLDGSDLKKIPINLPTGLYVWGGGRLTQDAKTIVFNVIGGSSQEVGSYIYSCSLDGSNLKKLTDGSYAIQGVY
jgi:hypothetical protein